MLSVNLSGLTINAGKQFLFPTVRSGAVAHFAPSDPEMLETPRLQTNVVRKCEERSIDRYLAAMGSQRRHLRRVVLPRIDTRRHHLVRYAERVVID